ncbi:MAG: RdgB/HAM1 family non-canonical purine NTP pyrophosphatase [Bacteroidota bacterium]
MEKPRLFFGTGNAKKLKEISEILGDRYAISSFRDLENPPEVEETEPTLEGNAILKAKAYYALTGLPTFADDTGLEVDALGGRPGVYSARYAGPAGDAVANMTKLLGELEGVEDRSARFRTVIAFYDGQALKTYAGELRGSIGYTPRGTKGFGYDPIFFPEGSERTLAEYSADEKNAISHRGRATRNFIEHLT